MPCHAMRVLSDDMKIPITLTITITIYKKKNSFPVSWLNKS